VQFISYLPVNITLVDGQFPQLIDEALHEATGDGAIEEVVVVCEVVANEFVDDMVQVIE
jgi:hypothetical protein